MLTPPWPKGGAITSSQLPAPGRWGRGPERAGAFPGEVVRPHALDPQAAPLHPPCSLHQEERGETAREGWTNQGGGHRREGPSPARGHQWVNLVAPREGWSRPRDSEPTPGQGVRPPPVAASSSQLPAPSRRGRGPSEGHQGAPRHSACSLHGLGQPRGRHFSQPAPCSSYSDK